MTVLSFAKKVKKPLVVNTGPDVQQMLKVYQKDHGEAIGDIGGALKQVTRLPSGLFPLDLALGGGFPRGRASMVWGPESSGKTNLVLCLIAMHQHLYPDDLCIFFDQEHSFDPTWATMMGVDTKRLVVVNPTYAEKLVDMVEGFLGAYNCGLVVIDSLAAIVTANEISSSAEKALVGGASNPIGKLVRKTTFALSRAEAEGRKPTLIYVNQIRHKIGVMFGDPETSPGGNAVRFQIAMSLRMYGKNEKDTKISSTMPVTKNVSFVVRKWKAPILSAAGTYDQIMIPHKGFQVGECDDWSTVSEYLKQMGQFKKADKSGWEILGEPYKTLDAFKERLYHEKAFGVGVREAIITKFLKEGKMLEGGAL